MWECWPRAPGNTHILKEKTGTWMYIYNFQVKICYLRYVWIIFMTSSFESTFNQKLPLVIIKPKGFTHDVCWYKISVRNDTQETISNKLPWEQCFPGSAPWQLGQDDSLSWGPVPCNVCSVPDLWQIPIATSPSYDSQMSPGEWGEDRRTIPG